MDRRVTDESIQSQARTTGAPDISADEGRMTLDLRRPAGRCRPTTATGSNSRSHGN